MSKTHLITGPTFVEMLNPEKIDPKIRNKALEAKTKDPLDPINLFNITWKDSNNQIYHEILPKELTGVEATIVVLYGKELPTGSHKVGATYSVLIEKAIQGLVDPTKHTIVWPSTGNYGIGGAWVGCRMAFDSVVILPEEMSQERFDIVKGYGARLELTPGCESNVKEIYDKCHELKKADPDRVRIMNQFEEFGNYRFHYFVTGNTIIELAQQLQQQGIGTGTIAAFVSAMGSAGTIAAGDRLKQQWPEHKIIGLEPIQCPTLFWNGYGGHDIQGIGDKHVTWIHNVMNMDALMCIDDIESKKGLQLLVEKTGWDIMTKQYGMSQEKVEKLSTIFGISGVCNVLGAIKTAKFYGFGKDDVIVTMCTDAIDRYHSVMDQMTKTYGQLDELEAEARLQSIFHQQKLDWIQEGNIHTRNQWHNLKYYTWVEQQGKTIPELNAQREQSFWQSEQNKVASVDRKIEAYRRGK